MRAGSDEDGSNLRRVSRFPPICPHLIRNFDQSEEDTNDTNEFHASFLSGRVLSTDDHKKRSMCSAGSRSAHIQQETALIGGRIFEVGTMMALVINTLPGLRSSQWVRIASTRGSFQPKISSFSEERERSATAHGDEDEGSVAECGCRAQTALLQSQVVISNRSTLFRRLLHGTFFLGPCTTGLAILACCTSERQRHWCHAQCCRASGVPGASDFGNDLGVSMDLFSSRDRCLESPLAARSSACGELPVCDGHDVLPVHVAPIRLFSRSASPCLDSNYIRLRTVLCYSRMVWKEAGLACCAGCSDANWLASV